MSLPRAMQLYQLMRVGSAVLAGILLAKTGISLEQIGQWEALLFLGSAVVFTGINGLMQGIAPAYQEAPRERKLHFLSGVFGLFGGMGVVVSLLLWGTRSWVLPAVTGFSEAEGFGWFSLYVGGHLASLPLEMVLLLLKKPWKIILWGLVGWGGYLVAVIVPAWMGLGLTAMFQSLCLLAALKWGWALALMSSAGWRRPVWPDVQQYLHFSVPLILSSLLGNAILFFDGWLVLQWYDDASVFALYRYGARELPLALALATALGTAMIPVIGSGRAAGLAELKQRTTRLLHIVMPVTALLIVGAGWYFPLVFNTDFAAAAPLFQISLLIALSRVLLPNSILLALQQSRMIFYTGIAELAVKVILGVLMLYWAGLPGLMWSMVLACWFEKIVLGWYLHRYSGISVQQWLPLRWYVFYIILVGVTFWLAA